MANAQQGGDTRVSGWLKANRYWVFALGVLAGASVLWHYGPALWNLVREREALQEWVAQLGWLGPVALVLLNALQIVFAPVPGYVVQIAAGYLYGAIWGGMWATLGLLLGASAAFWLARGFGRPVAEGLIGRTRLERWEKVTHSTSTVVWCAMLLGPTGDVPYYLAGLSRVSFVKVFAITAVLRIPGVFVAAAAGASVVVLTWWQWAIVLALLTGIIVIILRYQQQIMLWMDGQVQRRVAEEATQDE